MEDLLKSPEMLLIVSGIVALVSAITKGGFSIGPVTIPSLSAMQCKYICGLGVVLFVTGVGLVVASSGGKEVVDVSVVPPEDGKNKESASEKNTEPITVDIKGKLVDFFENPIKKARVNCDFEGNPLKSDDYTTTAKGYFSFKNIPNRKTVFLTYGNYKDTLTADSNIQDIIQFRINPIDINICYTKC